ncbi:iron uptake porin [Synechocystis sp. CACIAM 05]|uniref:iron uptake porin n=1 Tax=Synechocystis sp. CACIAM 05 TaxID=1933929 RepID=UPI00138E6FAE|nr:iron uptake porin [Synechocystis sp. CACIAM 05]QHU99177.1 S-layer protein [Synechocystis sp. CACIAM 05]
MNKLTSHLLKLFPLALGSSLAIVPGAMAQSTGELATPGDFPRISNQGDSLELMRRRQNAGTFNAATPDITDMSQVTSVSELRDVQPTAWAYEALKSLVERYGCIVGYPDRTFRGDRALSRWEFAAGLNACMNVMERLIQENVAVLREDIDKLKRLMQEFEAELAALGARIDNLEVRTSFLEDHQFSTTTKLNGVAVFALVDQWGGDKAVDWRQQDNIDNFGAAAPAPVEENATLSSRVRLNFDTSFTGKDLLRTRLQAGSVPNLSGPTGTNMARLSFDGSSPDNNVDINKLFYRFPMGNLTTWIGGVGLALDDVFKTYNPYLESGDTGAVSRFSRYNPFVNRGPEGTGGALRYKFNDVFTVSAAYLADTAQASTPSDDVFTSGGNTFRSGNGFFNGSYSTGIQFDIKPVDNFSFGISYLHKYYSQGDVNLTGSTGSRIASNPFYQAATTMDTYNLQATWQITDKFNLSGWFGYANATAQGFNTGGNPQNRDGLGADLWTWNAALSVIDVFKEGAVLSLSGGLMPYAPYVGSLSGDRISNDRNSPYIIEAQYQFPVNKNIQITPGAYVILSPEANSNNSAIWVGVLRTTFKF